MHCDFNVQFLVLLFKSQSFQHCESDKAGRESMSKRTILSGKNLSFNQKNNKDKAIKITSIHHFFLRIQLRAFLTLSIKSFII